MRARLLAALAVALLAGAGEPPPCGEVQSQVIPPGSRWIYTHDDGRTWVDEFGRDGVWRSTYTARGVILEIEKYTLNPTASPPRIDATSVLGPRHGIYRLEGDRLLICMGAWNTRDRPTRFAHGPGRVFWTLRRVK